MTTRTAHRHGIAHLAPTIAFLRLHGYTFNTKDTHRRRSWFKAEKPNCVVISIQVHAYTWQILTNPLGDVSLEILPRVLQLIAQGHGPHAAAQIASSEWRRQNA